MKKESPTFLPLGISEPRRSKEPQLSPLNILGSEAFDLNAYFDIEKEEDTQLMPDLLLTLRDDANESIATITSKVTAKTFAAGATLTSRVFSTLGSLVGSCGIFCGHTLGALGKVGSGLSASPGLGSQNIQGFSIDKNGNFKLDGNINTLSKMSGISSSDLISGKFAPEDILGILFSGLGESLNVVFGFGLLELCIGCMFDSFLPSQKNDGAISLAA